VPPGIFLYTSNRLEELLEALATHLGQHPLPPLESETIVVPGQGLARWLQLRLAESHGIAAGLEMPFPGAFLQQLLQRASRASAASAAEPDLFGKDVLTWRLWRLLGDPTLQNDLGPAASYCGDDPDGRKRSQLCERLAACFDDYQLYRDDLLRRAAGGDDLAELAPHGPWQARLWRALLRDAGFVDTTTTATGRRGKKRVEATPFLFPELAETPAAATTPTKNPAHRLEQLRVLLEDPKRAAELLPKRLWVFGATTLPPAFLELLQRIARHVQVALFVPQPTHLYFGDVRKRGESPGDHPLLARLGTEAREFADQLQDLEERIAPLPFHHLELRTLARRDVSAPRTTLLSCVQQDLAELIDRGAPTQPAPRYELEAGDDSLRVHDCHSPQRELEVVRDQILAAFEADAALQPHDVLVLVPDIDTYAPYARAVFGPVADYLPFHIADRSPASELPLCASLLAILQLAQDRLQVYDVLHLLEDPSIQRRFGLFAGDLPVLRNRCDQAGIRWGLDGAMRERQFKVPAFEENAWLPGLDRLLLGAATGPVQDLCCGILPVGDTTDSRDELLARFVHFATTLFAQLQTLQRPQPMTVWADLIDELLAVLFLPASAEDEAAVQHVQKATAGLRTLVCHAKLREPIAPIVVQDWLRNALQQAAGARGFLAGAVTVAALLPMRTVPVKHLFVCGLDDQSFPRRDHPAPFDLLAQQRRPGDRSSRLDDRQLFLDAVLAARQRLHLTFVGHSQKDDSECAPSLVLDELLDLVDRSCEAPAGYKTPRDFVRIRHPLQPWSQQYRSGKDARLFTYSLHAAHEPGRAEAVEEPWSRTATPAPEHLRTHDLPIERLREFWWHPCRFYLQNCLGVRVRIEDDDDTESEPFAVEPLDRWRLQDHAVRRALRGDPPPEDALALARATGLLPIGGHGAAAFVDVFDEAQRFLEQVRQHGKLSRRSLRFQHGAYELHGEIEGVGKEALVFARIAKLKNKDRLRSWLYHVICAVVRHQGDATMPTRTYVIGKDETEVFTPLPKEVAHQQLDHLIAGYELGLQMPLPFFEKSSYAFAQAMQKAKGGGEQAARLAARRAWLPKAGDSFAGSDSEDASIDLCMRGREPVDSEEFAEWATRLWTAVMEHTQTS
jgi:exodeoxyribonuclease V gamma subunit